MPPRIAEAAGLQPGDQVIEVGPGLGILTEELAHRLDPKQGRLVAVELDDDLLPTLRERFSGHPHVTFVQADVLDLSPAGLSGGEPYKVVANLPYYITSAILRHFLDAEQKPLSLTVMVQREVADRMTAHPPDMSLLAVAVQFYGKPRTVFRVPPGAFRPPPKVDSAVVHIEVYGPDKRPVSPASEQSFFHVVHAGFSQKRKQLVNTISSGLSLPKETARQALESAGISPARRAETLTLHEWAKLEEAVSSKQQAASSIHPMIEPLSTQHSPLTTHHAFAKLNLTLEIIGRREDSYHDITSVIQAIDLHDTLQFAPAEEGVLTLECDNPALSSEGEANLVLKAARLLQQATGTNSGAHITLQKCIPLSAGLGGGSSDAAATLLGLTDLWSLRLGKRDLLDLAAALGSDVPFFLEGPTALVEGRGEHITRIPSPPPGWAVLVCPQYALKDKTKRLYAALTRADLSEGIATHRLIAALVAGGFPDSSLLYNAFERVAYNIFDKLLTTRQLFMRASGRDVHLSGSGPTLYTLYPASQEAHARRLHANLEAAGLQTFLTQLIVQGSTFKAQS